LSAGEQYLRILGAYAPLSVEHSGVVEHALTEREKREAEATIRTILAEDSTILGGGGLIRARPNHQLDESTAASLRNRAEAEKVRRNLGLNSNGRSSARDRRRLDE